MIYRKTQIYKKAKLRQTKERYYLFLQLQIVFAGMILVLNFNHSAKGLSENEQQKYNYHSKVEEKDTLTLEKEKLKTKSETVLKKEEKTKEEKRKLKYAHLNNEHNQYLLAKLIACEYGSQKEEDLEKKIIVGIVVLNRVISEEFPDTVEDVIFQKNQFQPIIDGSWDKKEPTKLDYLAAKMALENHPVLDVNGKELNESLYFMNPHISDKNNVRWFKENLTYVGKLGEHEFYK